MKAQEIFTGKDYKNIRVDFYVNSYQYAEPKHYTICTIGEFEDVKRFTENKLNYSKNNSTKVPQEDIFWATFTLESGEELFEERVRV
jgi:hypothetical protein